MALTEKFSQGFNGFLAEGVTEKFSQNTNCRGERNGSTRDSRPCRGLSEKFSQGGNCLRRATEKFSQQSPSSYLLPLTSYLLPLTSL